MSNTKKYALIMLASSLVILIMLFLPGMTEDKSKDKKDEITKKVTEIESEKSQTSVKKKKAEIESNAGIIVNSVIGDFIMAVNNKDFTKAFSMIDGNYKKDFDLTQDFFKERYSFVKEKKFTISDIDDSKEDRYIVNTILQDIDAEKDKGMVRKTFTVLKTENYSLIDIGIESEQQLNKGVMIKPNVTFTLEKLFVTPNGSIAIIYAANKTKNYFSLQNGRFGFYAMLDKYTYEHSLLETHSEDYIITPGITKKFIVQFKQVKHPNVIGAYYKGTDNSDTTTEGEKMDVFKFN